MFSTNVATILYKLIWKIGAIEECLVSIHWYSIIDNDWPYRQLTHHKEYKHRNDPGHRARFNCNTKQCILISQFINITHCSLEDEPYQHARVYEINNITTGTIKLWYKICTQTHLTHPPMLCILIQRNNLDMITHLLANENEEVLLCVI
jgi:hypothetical protein